MTTRMARVLAATVLAGACASGCITGFDKPIDAVPSVDVDPALVGRWRCVNGDSGNAAAMVLSFNRKTAREYAITADVPADKSAHMLAYASTVNGVSLLNARELKDEGESGWMIWRYAFLRANVLEVQALFPDKFADALKTVPLRAALEGHLADVDVEWLDLAVCVRLAPDEPEPVVEKRNE
jgi:hypothetical protein